MKYFFEQPINFSIVTETNSPSIFCIVLKFGKYEYRCCALNNLDNELKLTIFVNDDSASCYNIPCANFPQSITLFDTDLIRNFILWEFKNLIKNKTIVLNMF